MESARMASENAKNPPQMTTSTGNLEVFPHPARSLALHAIVGVAHFIPT
jgi:hypothetical protein